jgi:hypothetical protein
MLDPDPDEMNADPQPWFEPLVFGTGTMRGHIRMLSRSVSVPLFILLDTDPVECYWVMAKNQCSGSGSEIRIRIHRIHMFLGLKDPDPDPLGRSMDPDPDPSISKHK